MKKVVLLLCLSALYLGFNQSAVKAQTPGTLSFSVTTTEPAGNYNNVNVIALWIEDTNGTFVKTKIRYAASRIAYLTRWITESGYNVVDAVTGPTRSTHGTLTFNWNATNVSAAVVADGYYRVYIQMSDKNSAGPITYVQFQKDSSAHTVSPANVGNFTNMSLNWNPTSGIEEMGKTLQFDCSPNPMLDNAQLTYTLEKNSDVTISLHDLSGKNVAVLSDGNQGAGQHQLQWGIKQVPDLKAGVYFLRINTGNALAVKKIVVTR